MKRKVIALALTAVFALAGVAYAVNPIKISVNGREVKSDVPAQMINNRVMVPARAVAEALGANVNWHAPSNSVVITKDPTGKVTMWEWNTLYSYYIIQNQFDLLGTVAEEMGNADAFRNSALFYSKLAGKPDLQMLEDSYKTIDKLQIVVNKSVEFEDMIKKFLPSTRISEDVIRDLSQTRMDLQAFVDKDKAIKDKLKNYFSTGELKNANDAMNSSKELLLKVSDLKKSIDEKKNKYHELFNKYLDKQITK